MKNTNKSIVYTLPMIIVLKLIWKEFVHTIETKIDVTINREYYCQQPHRKIQMNSYVHENTCQRV